MPNFAQNTADAQQIIIQLLFTDIELGFTFVETARVTSVPETKQRNLANAVKVYRTISSKVTAMTLLAPTRQQIEAKLLELSEQLAAWGESV